MFVVPSRKQARRADFFFFPWRYAATTVMQPGRPSPVAFKEQETTADGGLETAG